MAAPVVAVAFAHCFLLSPFVRHHSLPLRPRPAEIISTAQAILLLLVLVVQLITLYDNMAIRRLLAAAGPLGSTLEH